MEVAAQDIEALAALAGKLEPFRKESGSANDMFEAAADWKNLIGLYLKYPAQEGHDFSGRLQQEIDLFDDLQRYYGSLLEQTPDYAKIMEIGARMIAYGKKLEPHPDGYLRANKIVRETFAFLQTQFGLQPGTTPDTSWDYASDRLRVEIDFPTHHHSWCKVVDLADPPIPESPFRLEDLLFMGGRSQSMALPLHQEIATEADVQASCTAIADVLRHYGADVLASRPGALERLAAAARERERLYVEECERWHAEEVAQGRPGGGPLALTRTGAAL